MSLIDELVRTLGLSRQPLILAALEQLAEGVIVADEEGRLVFVNSAAAAIHGVKRLDVTPEDYSDAYQLLTIEEEPFVPEELPLARAVLKGETVTDAHWKIRRPDGVVVDAIGTAQPVFDEDGNQVASVLTLSDRTAELASKRELAAALQAKETLLYEVNHRVKNNLALVSSMLRLQSRGIEDEKATKAFSDIASRVAVLADIHGRLYQTGGHNQIEAVGFLGEILTDTVTSLGKDRSIEAKVTRKGEARLSIDAVVPLALALNELVLNSIKHAFGGVEKPLITAEIEASDKELSVVFRDNGTGLPAGAEAKTTGIGRALISNLSSQLGSTVEQKTDEPGFYMRISVPLGEDDPARLR
jgi:PAS domain S-box-containing protein